MFARTRIATLMAYRDQVRRPLIPILLVTVPAFVVLWSVAITRPESQRVRLSGGTWVTTTMKDLHGPEMAEFSVAAVCALLGVFVMQAALRGDRRLVVAGVLPGEAMAARMLVLMGAAVVAVAVSAGAVAFAFTPDSWTTFVAALALTAAIYSAIGAIVGAVLDRVAATYLILFAVTADIGVVQTPMFHPTPTSYAPFLPGYAPTRIVLEGSYADDFRAVVPLLIGIGWVVALAMLVVGVLRRLYPQGV